MDHMELQWVEASIANARDGAAEYLSVDTSLAGVVATERRSGDRYTLRIVVGTPSSASHAHNAPSVHDHPITTRLQEAVRTLRYHNVNTEPTVEARTLEVVAFDSAAVSASAWVSVAIVPINDNTPVVVPSALQGVFTEGSAAVAITDAGLTLTDVDHNDLFPMVGATVRLVTLTGDAGSEVLSAANNGGGSVSIAYQQASNTLVVSGAAPVSVYQSVLQSLRYGNSAEEPTPGTREVEIVVDDGLRTSVPKRVSVRVEVINDRTPVLLLSAPGAANFSAVFVEESGWIPFVGTVSLTDADSGQLPLQWVRVH